MTNERRIDEKLHIKTMGDYNHQADGDNFPYEPTPYPVLERLAESGLIRKGDHLLDYGCGKGRVAIYLALKLEIRVTGIDYNPEMIRQAQANEKSSGTKGISFICADARSYEVTAENVFFFFNPFDAALFKEALQQILWSWYENRRRMLLLLYYPHDEYVAALMCEEEFCFFDEVDCRDLFGGNDEREKILAFELPG